MIPLCRPLLPTADALLPYLREIDANRVYSNYGPLERRLQARLEDRFGAPVALLSSGTAALIAALSAVRREERGTCLCPSWTFVASGAAICGAGLSPYFVDVERATWMPDIDGIGGGWTEKNVAAMMVVGPFGMPAPTARLDV